MSLYLGMISGTSMDAIDAALVEIAHDRTAAARDGAALTAGALNPPALTLRAAAAPPLDPELRARLERVIEAPERASLDEVGQLDVAVGRAFADVALELLEQAGVSPAAVVALGSHGQTLRHRTDVALPFTWQIGDPSTIAERTGITVVADFRRRDVAAGGQGAPLLPVLHDQVFRSPTEDRVIVNLGGIANVTVLARGRPVIGFDTGPANRLLDAWIERHHGVGFDNGGAWAASGRVDAELLTSLLEEPYLSLPAPKSTGRELFNLPWLERRLGGSRRRPEDVQATLLEYTAFTVARAIEAQAPAAALYACGGGVHNAALIAALARRRAPHPVATTAALGLDPDYVEAIAFAWFAQRTLAGLPSNAPSVTGARGPRILGGVYRHA